MRRRRTNRLCSDTKPRLEAYPFQHGPQCPNGIFCWCQRELRLARLRNCSLNVSNHHPKLVVNRKIGRK